MTGSVKGMAWRIVKKSVTEFVFQAGRFKYRTAFLPEDMSDPGLQRSTLKSKEMIRKVQGNTEYK